MAQTGAMEPVDAAAVDAAAQRLSGVVPSTPLQRSERLSARVGGDVWLKREDLQVVRSYKVRGAYNLITQLPEQERAAGVVCASAGNHGQGVAYACRALGVLGRVYVPRTTPRQKRDRMAALGGEVVECTSSATPTTTQRRRQPTTPRAPAPSPSPPSTTCAPSPARARWCARR